MSGKVNDVELKPADRITEAGILLAEQVGMSLLNDAYKFPEITKGTIKPEGSDGTLRIEGPVHQLVRSSMKERHAEQGSYFAVWTHTDIMDRLGRSLSSKDQVAGGDFLVVLVNNRLGSHTDYKTKDGQVQIQMDGQTVFTPRDGAIRDMTNTLSDGAGNYLGDMRLTARPVGPNVLNISAQYKFKETYLGDIELTVTLDPSTNYSSADFEIKQKYNPPPPPLPVPATAGAGA